ncbi:MAG: DUF4263 domain-containing protein [Acetobacteraceae bacterium]|nr:DUF4263 domain-containing protein [Acetobacteraceae bacterium]
MFEAFVRDLVDARRDEQRLTALLSTGDPLGEAADILPFMRTARHLAAWLGRANSSLGDVDLLAMEKPLLGGFRCDIAIGDSETGQFTLVELEDAKANSVFEPVRGRDYPRWSRRFERGFSQLVDWAWRIDHERQPSATLAAAFGTADPKFHYVLVIGRDRWIGDAGRARLNWRRLHNGISGQRTTLWTYDDLLTFVRVRLRAAERDASALIRTSRETGLGPD